MTQDEIIWQNEVLEMAEQAGFTPVETSWHFSTIEAFAKLVAAKEREHWKEIVDGQLRCITALNDIVGGEGSTTTSNILNYSRWEQRLIDAVLEEREACAKVCDDIDKSHWGCEVKASWCSDAIRARGEA